MTRPKTYGEQQLLVAASLYYIDGINQDEIAKRFKVSRPTVVRMLKEVREQGLVEIKLTKELPHTRIIGAEIESKFAASGLEQVIVVDEHDLSNKEVVARAASVYLENNIRDSDVLGVGWSTTLSHLATFYEKTSNQPKKIVQLAGAAGGVFGSNSQEISIRLSQAMMAPVNHLASPIFLANEVARNAIVQDRGVQETIALFSKCTIAIIGVGEVSKNSTLVKSKYLKASDMKEIESNGGVGDLLANFYREDGSEIDTSWNQLRVSASLDQIKKIDNVVAVSAGANKAKAVIGALKGGYINTLIIDLELANELVN